MVIHYVLEKKKNGNQKKKNLNGNSISVWNYILEIAFEQDPWVQIHRLNEMVTTILILWLSEFLYPNNPVATWLHLIREIKRAEIKLSNNNKL